MITFAGETLGDVYAAAVRAVFDNGEMVSPRGKLCRELRPVSIETTRWGYLKKAKVDYKFATAEALAWIAGWPDVKWLTRFRPNMVDFSDDGQVFFGAYGQRIRPQLAPTISRIRNDPDTRQAVINIWDKADCSASSKDMPCNTQILLKARNSGLHMTVIRRSADAVWGVPYDHHGWWALLTVLSDVLFYEPASLTEVIDSFHVYDPSAGFYGQDRIDAALQAEPRYIEQLYSWPRWTSLQDAWDGCEAIRACIENWADLKGTANGDETDLVDYLTKIKGEK